MSNVSGMPPVKPNDFVKILENLRRNMTHQIEIQRLLATLDREKFMALVKSGFSEAQALDLLKAEKMRVTI